MTDIRFALAQIDTCVGDLDSNADKVMRYAHLAAQQGAQVVVFPEMTLTGYPIETSHCVPPSAKPHGTKPTGSPPNWHPTVSANYMWWSAL